MADYNLNLNERLTIRLPQGEKTRLFALAEELHTNVSAIVRILMNSNQTLHELLTQSGLSEEEIEKRIFNQ